MSTRQVYTPKDIIGLIRAEVLKRYRYPLGSSLSITEELDPKTKTPTGNYIVESKP